MRRPTHTGALAGRKCGHGVPTAKIRLGTPCPRVPTGNDGWCKLSDVMDGESLSVPASHWHNCLYCSLCEAHVINIVVCRAVAQQAAATDDHQPFISHFSLTFLLIKTSMHQDSNTRIVFDKLVVKGEQEAITESLNASQAPSLSSHAVM